MISAIGQMAGSCPGSGERSTLRHSCYIRHLQDLPVQGAVVRVKFRMSPINDKSTLARFSKLAGRVLPILPKGHPSNPEDQKCKT